MTHVHKSFLPDKVVCTAIADAVHAAVETEVGDNAWTRCHLYAVAGATIASEIVGREYLVQGGTLDVITAPRGIGFTIDSIAGGIENGEFHSWFSTVHRGTIEIVDLASRHYKRHAERAGIPWQRDELPPYLWVTEHQQRRFKVTLSADAKTTFLLRDELAVRLSGRVENITRDAFARVRAALGIAV